MLTFKYTIGSITGPQFLEKKLVHKLSDGIQDEIDREILEHLINIQNNNV